MLGAWIWNCSPAIFSLFSREIRWYGLLFALGFALATYVMNNIYRQERRNTQAIDKMLLYMIVGVVVGARLGHVIFYDPEYYFSHPWKIAYVWEGGLASHGGAFGTLLATALYCRNTKQAYLMVLDRLIIACTILCACIRLGNFANSEIYGKPTESRYGVVFARSTSEHLSSRLSSPLQLRAVEEMTETPLQPIKAELRYPSSVDSARLATFLRQELPLFFASPQVQKHFQLPKDFEESIRISKESNGTRAEFLLWGIPRHPTQLYEALFYALSFVVLFLWWKKQLLAPLPKGTILGASFILLMGFRVMVEFLKERQEEFENPLWLNMGQLLSLPLILAGGLLLLYAYRKKKPSK